jgi:sialate O-acetylesterase
MTIAATPAGAVPTLDPLFSDHAVLQRGQSLRITGSANAREQLTVSLAGSAVNARANENGRWAADLPPLRAGGPYILDVRGHTSGSTSARDILLGDVWLCSGQSNMEFPLSRTLNGATEASRANDPQLRIMTIAKDTSATPRTDFKQAPSWAAITPELAADFSAACYIMVRELRKTQKVPIGAIDSTWGGTPIRAWMSLSSVRASGAAETAGLVEQYVRDPAAAQLRFGKVWDDWWRQQSRQAAGGEPWRNSGSLAWKPMPAFSVVDEWGPSWIEWNGAFWARHEFDLTAAEARQAATLSLGVIDDMDRTYVNGSGVGLTNDPSKPRHYPVANGILKPGRNEILVYVRDAWAQGGFRGPAEVAKLALADGRAKPLTTGWEYALIDDAIGAPPSAPWEGNNGASTIYNAMIAPLGATSLKGVAWYQGETDVGQPGYDRRLAAMFSNWRTQFRNPQLPFLIVGLAAFGTPRSTPFDSGWARVLDEQRTAVQRDPAAALVPTIDLGEWFDIHPANKIDVGKRLALAAETVAYRDAHGKVAPLPLQARRVQGGVEITFSKPLQVIGGVTPTGFELCGTTQASCRFSDARIEGNRVVVAGDGGEATRVRYAWADAPIVNLYDLDLLPASSFELPID